ncbi:MAG: hypothetical protein LBJ20_00020 [Candidatus Methanoplasma sp.]|nr:hypothetical protein [Candidatus Methanoplasma sp.]
MFYDVRNNHTIEATGTPHSASPEGGDSETRGEINPGSGENQNPEEETPDGPYLTWYSH